MRVYLLRHGETVYNREHRYQGLRDIPLSQEGEAALIRADFDPDTVWVSPLSRARRTAEILFPKAAQIPVEGLVEMDFGVFEGRNYLEMENDLEYRDWVEGGCVGRCPGGEGMDEYAARVTDIFARLVEQALTDGREELVILAHGGVQLAVMDAFALPERDRFQWHAPCAGGFVLETDRALWTQHRKLNFLHMVVYTKEDMTG